MVTNARLEYETVQGWLPRVVIETCLHERRGLTQQRFRIPPGEMAAERQQWSNSLSVAKFWMGRGYHIFAARNSIYNQIQTNVYIPVLRGNYMLLL